MLLSRWLGNRSLDPASFDKSVPAAPGTAMYRSCEGDECAVTLVAPSGERIDLADVHPDLAASLGAEGLADVSLSPNGHWLGRPEGGGYRLYHLDGGPVSVGEVAADPRGDRWELVGWSEQSYSPVLALYDSDTVVRYAIWGPGYDPSHRPRLIDVPDGVITTPIHGSTRARLQPVADPVLPEDGELPRIATTTPPSDEWFVLGGPGRAGQVVDTSDWEEGYNGTSFEDCVGSDETLVGPRGQIHSWWTRGSRRVHADMLTITTAVYSRDPSVTEPVAVVLWACDPAPWALDREDPYSEGIPGAADSTCRPRPRTRRGRFSGCCPTGRSRSPARPTGRRRTYVSRRAASSRTCTSCPLVQRFSRPAASSVGDSTQWVA